jgi:hypothetical protein
MTLSMWLKRHRSIVGYTPRRCAAIDSSGGALGGAHRIVRHLCFPPGLQNANIVARPSVRRWFVRVTC